MFIGIPSPNPTGPRNKGKGGFQRLRSCLVQEPWDNLAQLPPCERALLFSILVVPGVGGNTEGAGGGKRAVSHVLTCIWL